MKACVVHQWGAPIAWEDVPDPVVGEDQVVIAVKAVSVNRSLDIEVHESGAGWPVHPPLWTGADPAGVVVSVGARVREFRPGDRVVVHPILFDGTCLECLNGRPSICVNFRVLGIHLPGGDAEYVAAPANCVVKLPAEVDFVFAAATVLSYGVAWELLVNRACVGPADTVLIWGASGGVGSAGLDIARLFGARTIAVISSDDGAELAQKLGARWVVNRTSHESVADQVDRITDGRGVDVVFENMGAQTWPQSLRCLAREGRLVTCGTALGGNFTTLDLRALYRKHVALHLTGGFSRATTIRNLDLLAKGRISPAVGLKLPLQEAEAAQALVKSGRVMGKAVLLAS
jgi:NADPH:quinone reductase-like Zn-dependent oxidoreductase